MQMGANNTAVANAKLSETGGTAEDDVDAIVDAAEEDQSSIEDSDDSDGLFNRAMKTKPRRMKKAMRAAMRNFRRKERKAAGKVRKARKAQYLA